MDDYTFLPNFIDSGDNLYYSFPDGRLVKVPDEESETFKLIRSYDVKVGLDLKYLSTAWHDQLNPLEKHPCNCGRQLMKKIIMQGYNIYVCKCGIIIKGDPIS